MTIETSRRDLLRGGALVVGFALLGGRAPAQSPSSTDAGFAKDLAKSVAGGACRPPDRSK